MYQVATGNKEMIYYRLVALWVICEAMLGGIIHGLRIPVSGLVVGSCAVICISLIAWYQPKKGAIIKATLIVAIFKMMLSPQAGVPAYIAVFFQGAMGELLFWNRRYFRVSCMLLSVMALLESGLQRILVLTIIYGNDLWLVVNNFFNQLLRNQKPANASFWIVSIYVGIHGLVGLIIGWIAGLLPHKILLWKGSLGVYHSGETKLVLPNARRKRKRLKKIMLVIWLMLLLIFAQSYLGPGEAWLPSNIVLKILVRSAIIVLGWIFLVGPLLKQVLHSWLKQKQGNWKKDIEPVVKLIPLTQQIVADSWVHSARNKGFARLALFGKLVLVRAMGEEQALVYILTGPIQSGKTTSIKEWAKNQQNIWGILTPVITEKRFFLDLATGNQFPMEAGILDEDVWEVGRFRFSKSSFEKATAIIRESMKKEGLLVFDEIGPLELRGEGFSNILKQTLRERRGATLLVVLEGVLDEVLDYFKIENAVVIRDVLEMEMENGE